MANKSNYSYMKICLLKIFGLFGPSYVMVLKLQGRSITSQITTYVSNIYREKLIEF